jgi:predicted transcriptional regulator
MLLQYTALQEVEMARSTTSVRLSDDLRRQLAAAAAEEDTTVTNLIERYVREGLACLHERQVVIALNYTAAHRDEIEAWVAANDRAMEEAERVAGERERLLA